MSEKILLIDDQAVMLRIISVPLQREGYTVLTAATGAEALQTIQREKPDLVILDIVLPDASGIEVCRRIRQELHLLDLPIILLSGLSEVETKVQGLEAGADEYVTKPVDPKELTARVRAQLTRLARLRAAVSSPETAAPVAKNGLVLGVIGAKGGVGTTTVAVNIALALARRRLRTAIVELRPYYGTLAPLLGLTPAVNLGGLMEMAAKAINERQVSTHLLPCELGLRALAGPQQLRDYRDIQPDQVEALLQTLTTLTDFTIIDLPHMPSIANRSALRKCNHVLVVLDPEESSVRAAQALLELLKAWGIRGSLVRLVSVNRTQSAQMISAQDIEKRLGCEMAGVVTAASDLAARAALVGSPLLLSAPDSLAAITLGEIAEQVEALSKA